LGVLEIARRPYRFKRSQLSHELARRERAELLTNHGFGLKILRPQGTAPLGWDGEVGALGFEPRSAGFLCAGSYPAGIHGSALQLVITGQQTRSQSFPITGAREDAVLPHTPIGQCHALRIFCCRLRRLIFFLRHFHLWLPLFFQARELLFIKTLLCDIYALNRPVHMKVLFGKWRARREFRLLSEGFEPETAGSLPPRERR